MEKKKKKKVEKEMMKLGKWELTQMSKNRKLTNCTRTSIHILFSNQ